MLLNAHYELPRKVGAGVVQKNSRKTGKRRLKFRPHHPLTDLAKLFDLKFLFSAMGTIMLTPHKIVET